MDINSAIQLFVNNHSEAITAVVTVLVMAITTWVARYKIPPTNWVLIVLRIVLGAVFDQIHPKDFKELASSSNKGKVVSNEMKQEDIL
jgi:hypothetical protein